MSLNMKKMLSRNLIIGCLIVLCCSLGCVFVTQAQKEPLSKNQKDAKIEYKACFQIVFDEYSTEWIPANKEYQEIFENILKTKKEPAPQPPGPPLCGGVFGPPIIRYKTKKNPNIETFDLYIACYTIECMEPCAKCIKPHYGFYRADVKLVEALYMRCVEEFKIKLPDFEKKRIEHWKKGIVF